MTRKVYIITISENMDYSTIKSTTIDGICDDDRDLRQSLEKLKDFYFLDTAYEFENINDMLHMFSTIIHQ